MCSVLLIHVQIRRDTTGGLELRSVPCQEYHISRGCLMLYYFRFPPTHPPPPCIMHQVLQSSGDNSTKSAVYGVAPPNAAVEIIIASNGAADDSYTVKSIASNAGQWNAFLKPTTDGGDVKITAHCATGCSNTTDDVIDHVTFGDVWYCAGQSNMWLPVFYSYSRNDSLANITAGKYDNIRLMAGDSQHGHVRNCPTSSNSIIQHYPTVSNSIQHYPTLSHRNFVKSRTLHSSFMLTCPQLQ